ncbi:MAG: hypothetical protein WBM24_20660 [Candidatus Sulfotelmatobacter sp.]
MGVAQNGQYSSNPPGQSAPIELALGNTSRRGTDFVLQYGLIRNDVATEVDIGVRNVAGESLPIRIATTSDVLLAWSGEKPISQALNAIFAKNQQRRLSISFRPTADDPIPIVRFTLGGALIATLSLSFVAEDDRLPIQAGGSYAGSSSAGVSLCTGKHPVGYKLDCASVKINGEPPYPGGKCAKNVNCVVGTSACGASADQRYSCIIVRPSPVGGIIHFDAILTADFVLEDASPQLMLLSEVEEANRLIQKKQECQEDWVHFIASQKGVAQFGPPEQGPRFESRDAPCSPFQSSLIEAPFHSSVPGAPDNSWRDVKAGGVRIRTTGRPVMVGIIPEAEKLSLPTYFVPTSLSIINVDMNVPEAGTNGWQIAIVRDFKIQVGVFLIGADFNQAGISIPSSLMVVDTPPAGTHVYTLRVLFTGTPAAHGVTVGKAHVMIENSQMNLAQARFFAYELSRGSAKGLSQ